MRRFDNAPIGNTCPDIDAVIEVLAGVADRLDDIADKLEITEVADDLMDQAGNLRTLFQGRRSALEELRSDNDTLRQWGNKQTERADSAEAECKALERQINDMETT